MEPHKGVLWSSSKNNIGFVSSSASRRRPENTCLRNQYRCSNGNCINSIWWCDFDNDCGDMSDERNCRESSGLGQASGEVTRFQLPARLVGSSRIRACHLWCWLVAPCDWRCPFRLMRLMGLQEQRKTCLRPH